MRPERAGAHWAGAGLASTLVHLLALGLLGATAARPAEINTPPVPIDLQLVAAPGPAGPPAPAPGVPRPASLPPPARNAVRERTAPAPAREAPVAASAAPDEARASAAATPAEADAAASVGPGGGAAPGDAPGAPGAGAAVDSGGAGGGGDAPASVLAATKPGYPPEARRAALEGVVLLRVAVGADGAVERVEILRSSGHGLLDDAAAAALRAWRFAPARRAGQAVAGTHDVRIRYRLGAAS